VADVGPRGEGRDSPAVRDPRRAGQVPWSLYGQGVGFAVVAAAACWAATRTGGLASIGCWAVGTASGLWAAHLLLLSAGWQLLSTALATGTSWRRRRAARRSGEQLLELRFVADTLDGGLSDLHRLLDERLAPDAECGSVGSTGDAVTCQVRGRDLPLMVAAVRRAVAGFPLPADAYLWAPELGRAGFGHVVPLRPGA